MKRNSGRFDSKTASAAGGSNRLPEPTVKTQVVIYKRQQDWLRGKGINRSKAVRELLDQLIADSAD